MSRQPIALFLAALLMGSASSPTVWARPQQVPPPAVDRPGVERPAGIDGIADERLFRQTLDAAFDALEYYGRYDSPEQRARVLEIGYRLVNNSRYRKFPFTFYLVDMSVPNAFALPGGEVFVTRGMLDLGLDDDMLACLLGHEIAHVTLEHGLRMQKRANLLSMLGTALVVGLAVGTKDRNRTRDYDPYSLYGPTRQGNGDIVQGAAMASLALSQLLLLSYSREFEDQADDEGQRLAAAAGFDPAGARRLWQTMMARIPLNKAYGYWRTHPFEDSRMRAAETRSQLLKVQPATPADELRRHTQDTLLAFVPLATPKTVPMLKDSALYTWPQGAQAEALRFETLHALRTEELDKKPVQRDYGKVIVAYRKQLDAVAELTPESPFLAQAQGEVVELEAQQQETYPLAQRVVAGGIFETGFLEVFLSNYPDAPEVPKVALALGDSYSRLQHLTEAVEQYLRAWRAAPDSPEGQRAQTGLHNLAPVLKQLAALQQLAELDEDPELQQLAAKRLVEIAAKYDDLENGAEYLRRFPNGPQAEKVNERLNTLADNLYTEIIVYQGVGDNAKALERMNRILTFAPLSPAAERLRDEAVFQT